jgi:stage II sporulation protein D
MNKPIIWTMLGWLCVMAVSPAPSRAVDSIRVLLAQGASRVTVSSSGKILVRAENGQEGTFTVPVTVALASGGISLNGAVLSGNGVVLTAAGQDLSVAVGDNPGAIPVSVGGALRIVVRGNNPPGLTVLNQVDLEEYVKGVVPAEMNSAWHPEALKVQAVVARTYAAYQRLANRDRDYDVAATVQDQVYRGRQGVDQRIQEAVETTRGLALVYQGAPILAAFSSTAAGPTEDAMNVWSKDLPYLKGVDCPFDANSPYYRWRVEFTLQDLEDKLAKQGTPIGAIASMAPATRSLAGRVAKLRVLHSRGELFLRGEDLRRLVGYGLIPSTQFEIESIGRTVVLAGRGSGHAVGLCQWGAKEMAGLGYPFDTILRYYFPATELKALRAVEPQASLRP